MSFKFFITTILIFILMLFNQSTFAAKKLNKIIDELNAYRSINSIDSLTNKSKYYTNKKKEKPTPPKYRSGNNLFDTQKSKKIYKENFNSPILLNESISGNNKTQIWDLNSNKIKDMIITFDNDNPINTFIDLNENNIPEIEYVFVGIARWIYFDKDEDGKFDFLFIDNNNNGKYEKIIKIEN